MRGRFGLDIAGALACAEKHVRRQRREPLPPLLLCQVTSVAGSGAFLDTDHAVDVVELFEGVAVRERRGGDPREKIGAGRRSTIR